MTRILPFLICLLSIQSLGQGKLDSFDINKAQHIFYSNPIDLYNYNETLVFTPGDTILSKHYRKTDGNYHPKVINVPHTKGGSFSGYYQQPSKFTHIGNTLYFAAADSTGYKNLYKYDNSNIAVYLPFIITSTKDSLLFTGLDMVTTTGNHICFRGYSNKGNGLCVYNIITKEGRLIDSFLSTETLFAYNNKLYFSARTTNPFDNELYEYDPVADVMKKYDLLANGSSNPYAFVINNNTLYFIANEKLYEFNSHTMAQPQVASTRSPFGLSFSLRKVTNSHRYAICTLGDNLFFSGQNSYQGHHLYQYSITKRQTTLIDTNLHEVQDMAIYNNKLFFSANDSTHGQELFMFDGINPPSLVADIFPGDTSSNPHSLTVANNRLFFSAEGKTIGGELFMYTEATATVQNTSFNAKVTLYPNPSSGNAKLQLTLQQQEALSISLTDISGRTVYQKPLSKYAKGTRVITLPTQELTAGIYIYHINNQDGVVMASGRLERQ